MAATKKEPDFSSLLLDFGEKIAKQAREPNILAYKPHKKQMFFHSAQDHIRLYIGGNRSGKSFGSVAEGIWWSTGTHPYQITPPPPLRGRVVAVDLLEGVNQIILPLYKRLVTPTMLKGGSWEKAFNSYERILNFANGSTIEFLSYEMKTSKFAGTSRHWLHMDEEPPKDIYQECMARLIDTEGSAWISMTPVEGITWLFDDIYKPTNEDPEKILIHDDSENGRVYRSPSRETTIIEVSMEENPYLTKKGIDRYLSTLDDDEREARSHGMFVQKSGKVFKNFSRETHVIPRVADPAKEFRDCAIYTSVDHGWNNPTAWLWHAVKPDGTVITFGEHYKSFMTIGEHAAVVNEKEQLWQIEVDHRTGDPAMKQTSGITGTSVAMEYSDRGLYLELDSVPRDIAVGLARMQQYFRLNDFNEPKWYITDDCIHFINEMKELHFRKYVSKKAEFDNNAQEEIQKKDDHTFDSARYFATFLPELTPEMISTLNVPKPMAGNMDYDRALWQAHVNSIEGEFQTAWVTVEEY